MIALFCLWSSLQSLCSFSFCSMITLVSLYTRKTSPCLGCQIQTIHRYLMNRVKGSLQFCLAKTVSFNLFWVTVSSDLTFLFSFNWSTYFWCICPNFELGSMFGCERYWLTSDSFALVSSSKQTIVWMTRSTMNTLVNDSYRYALWVVRLPPSPFEAVGVFAASSLFALHSVAKVRSHSMLWRLLLLLWSSWCSSSLPSFVFVSLFFLLFGARHKKGLFLSSKKVELPSIDLGTSCMLSKRSTIWATTPSLLFLFVV